jgi:hypothetical protein
MVQVTAVLDYKKPIDSIRGRVGWKIIVLKKEAVAS